MNICFNLKKVFVRCQNSIVTCYFASFCAYIGCLSASVHGNKQVGAELVLNLQLFKQANYASKHHCFSSNIWHFIEYLETGKKRHKQQLSNQPISQDDLDLLYRSISNNSKIKSMKSSKS